MLVRRLNSCVPQAEVSSIPLFQLLRRIRDSAENTVLPGLLRELLLCKLKHPRKTRGHYSALTVTRSGIQTFMPGVHKRIYGATFTVRTHTHLLSEYLTSEGSIFSNCTLAGSIKVGMKLPLVSAMRSSKST